MNHTAQLSRRKHESMSFVKCTTLWSRSILGLAYEVVEVIEKDRVQRNCPGSDELPADTLIDRGLKPNAFLRLRKWTRSMWRQ